MRNKIRPYLSFLMALIVLLSSIPSFVLESGAYRRDMEYLVSGNVISKEEKAVSPVPSTATVSKYIPVEDESPVSANIIINCNDNTMGTIQVFSDEKEIEPVDSKYFFEKGKKVEILATPYEYYEVAEDTRKAMDLVNKETGSYRMTLEDFNEHGEKVFIINFAEIKSVFISYDGISMEIGRPMRGGTVSSASIDGQAGYVRIIPEDSNQYYAQLDLNVLEMCQENLYKVREDKIPVKTSVVFEKDQTGPLITFRDGSAPVSDIWYINGEKQLFIEATDKESGVKSIEAVNNFPRELQECGDNLCSMEIDSLDFNEDNRSIKVKIKAEDNCRNVSENSIIIIYDDNPPEIKNISVNSTGRSFQQDGKSYFKPEKTIKVSLDIEDDVKLSKLDYKILDSQGRERWNGSKELTSSKIKFFEEIASINNFETGTYGVHFVATDMAGNSFTSVAKFYIDGTSPKIEIGIHNSGKKWYKNLEDIVIKPEISDEFTSDGLKYSYKVVSLNNKISLDETDSFIAAEKIKPDTDKWISLGVSGNGLKSYPASISANDIKKQMKEHQNGSYALLIWAKDGCENESEPESYVFHYDTDAPETINNVVFKIDGRELSNNAITPFGNFLNKQKVEINIEAEDKKDGLENYCRDISPEIEKVFFYYSAVNNKNNKSSAGVYKWLLGNNGNLTEPLVISKFHKDGTRFTAAIDVLEKGVPYEVFLVAEDKAGNRSQPLALKDVSEYDSNLVMVDQDGPIIEFSIDREFKEPDYQEKTQSGDKDWYRGNNPVTFTLALKDEQSGLFNWRVNVNGVEKWKKNFRDSEQDKNEMKNYDNATINLSKGGIGADGSYTFEVDAYDNAGNSSPPGMIKKTIYVDEHVPIITGLMINNNKKVKLEDTNKSKQYYNFFFKKPINIEVTATDFIGDSNNHGSGVKNVIYYLENIKDKKVAEDTLNAEKKDNPEGTYVASGSVKKITDFKGQVFVSAEDYTGQTSNPVGSGGIVIESQKAHNKHSSAKIKLQDTPYKDANGNSLYRKKPFIYFQTSDPLSGIGKNEWIIKAITGSGKEEKGELNIELQSDKNTKKGSSGWTFQATEGNLVLKAAKRYKVNTEKNSLVASLNLTDNAGHEKKAVRKVFSVDETAPEVFVEYDNNDVYNEKFYNKERYATIHVIDANFSAEACEIKTTGPEVTKSEWEHIAGNSCNGKVHSKDCEYVCRVGFVADGDYTFSFECTDLAGWSGSYGQVDDFTIDLTEPVIQVSYDNQNSQNGNYYKASRTATVQIEEHNFSPEDVSITMTAMDGGSAIAVPAVVGWSQNEDIHTATIEYDYDGEFTFDIEYTDLASNQAQEYEQDRFIIDITEPEIEIAGVADRSANKGKVQPVITCKDTNLEDVAISLKGANRGTVKADYDTGSTGDGMVYKLKDLERLKINDDIYTLHVTARDKAGNELEEEIHYSVNRFGSVYEYDQQTEALIKDYYSSKCNDLIIKEVNVNTLNVNRITYSKDGEIVTLKEGKDYKLSQSGDEFTWKEYIYTIYKENFDEEGKYILTLYSEDQADNRSDNKIKGKDIEFVIDKTAPSLVLSGVKDGGQYNEDSMELVVNVEDNMGLAGLEIYNDGINIADFDGETVEEAEGTLRVPLQSKNDWQELVVVTRDMAGNESRSEKISYLMTTNLFVQWYKNPWLFYGSMVVILLLAGIAEYFIRIRKGQKKKRMVG